MTTFNPSLRAMPSSATPHRSKAIVLVVASFRTDKTHNFVMIDYLMGNMSSHHHLHVVAEMATGRLRTSLT